MVEESGMNSARAAALAACSNVPQRTVRSKRAHLLDFEELPTELQTNSYIRGSYRRYGLTFWQTVWSLMPFNLHTETINVWSHVIGFIVFAMLTHWISKKQPLPITGNREWVGDIWDALHHRSLGEQPDPQAEQMCFSEVPNPNGYMPSNSSYMPIPDPLETSFDSGLHIGLLPELQRLHHQLVHVLVNEALKWPCARWPLYVFTTGAMICMALSAVCHGFACCGQHTNKYIWRLDYTGITILIVTSFFPILYYGMLCHPYLKLLYLVTTCVMGGTTAIACLLNHFNKPGSNGIRALMFSVLGLWGSVPVIHTLILNHDNMHMRIVFVLVALHGAIYLGGAAIYVARIPEKWKPGSYDIFLSSHQWFHFAVVAAALVHFYAMSLLIEWRDSSGGVCVVPFNGWPKSWKHFLQEEGEAVAEVLHIDDVWQMLGDLLHRHFISHLPGTRGAC